MKKKAAAKVPENENAFKHLIGRALLKRMAESLSKLVPGFSVTEFVALERKLEPLEMKPRVRFLRDELKKVLPADYQKALPILLRSAQTGKLSGFDLWPYSEFIQTYGLDDIDASLLALRELTPVFTSEFAVRPFLQIEPTGTLQFLLDCTTDEDPHLRRWASEGSRPRLPWGERLQDFVKNPEATLPILRALRFDPELYVRKSVANHLNDISKDHPGFVVKELARWKTEANASQAKNVDWVIRHALRSLIKAGDSRALHLIGVSGKPQIVVKDLQIAKKKIKIGERVEFSFTIESRSKKPQKLVIDYILHFVKSNQTTAPKVFKLKTFEIAPQQAVEFRKGHHFKKVTVREYYPGLHAVELQINGASAGRLAWHLIK